MTKSILSDKAVLAVTKLVLQLTKLVQQLTKLVQQLTKLYSSDKEYSSLTKLCSLQWQKSIAVTKEYSSGKRV